jgi:hypothetical protein
MRRAAAAFAVLALSALLAPQRSAAEARDSAREIVLNLPRPMAAGETAFIEVEIGALGRGQRVEITAADRSVGAISPFGVHAGQDTGTYTLPIPPDAVRDGRVALRVTVRQGGTSRPPTAQEVRGIRLSIVGAR